MANPTIRAFKGLNNVGDPLRLSLGWLAQADNVDITDSGAIVKRAGYQQTLAGTFTGAFSTFDFARMFVVDGGALKAMTGTGSAITLQTGLSPAPMHWTEINDQVFFSNRIDSGIILPDNSVLPWAWEAPENPTLAAVTGLLDAGTYQVVCTFMLDDGRETGTSDPVSITLTDGQALSISGIQQGRTKVYIAPAGSTVYGLAKDNAPAAMVWNASPDDLGVELRTDAMDPIPAGVDIVQAWKGRIYAAQYFPEANQTAIWFSQPLGFHLFNLSSDVFLTPGQVLMLAPNDDALMVGTESRIYAYDGTNLTRLSDYGVLPGQHWSMNDKQTLFWTTRGLCSAMPFTNLTERQVSVAPGLRAGGAIVQSEGRKRYLVALQEGGTAFNPYR